MRLTAILAVGLLLSSTGASAAAFIDRFNHTTTLLPDNTLLITGGQTTNAPAGATNSVQQVQLKDGANIVNLANLTVARTSHTATLLSNGDVLIAGGMTTTGVPVNTYEVFSPKWNCASAVGGSTMSSARHSHTATLLKDSNMGGKVLICGGFDGTPSVLNSCDIYTPGAPLASGCGAATGSMAAGPSMGTGRAVHSASLLKDGRVFLTGGLGQPNGDVPAGNQSLSQYVVTSEIFNPNGGGGFFTDAHALIEERAFHTATMMGNGQILIVGGLNGTNNLANHGFLTSTEIYDPISDSIAPGPHVEERKMSQSAVLDIGGAVHIFGGLGNYSTSYFNATATLPANPPDSLLTSAVPFTVDGVEAWGTINGGAIHLPFNFQMTPDPNNPSASSLPSGMIENGQVLFSTPSVVFDGGIAYLTPATLNNNGSPVGGVYADMTNTTVACSVNGNFSAVGGPAGTCGYIVTQIALSDLTGAYYVTPLVGATLTGTLTYPAFPPAEGSVTLAAAINSTVPEAEVTAGTLNGETGQTVQVQFPLSMVGATLLYNPTVAISAGTLTQTSTFTVTISAATGVLLPPAPATLATNVIAVDGTASFELSLANIAGTAIYAGVSGDAGVGPGAVVVANADGAATLASLVGTITYVPSQVDLSGDAFTDTFSTFVIDDMMFGDEEVYDPAGSGGNSWFFEWRGLDWSYSHTATLTPFGDINIYGGAACGYSSNCADGAARGPVPNPFARTNFPLQLPPWNSSGVTLTSARANHTSTVLPTGLILNTGGTNGPNILATSDLLNASIPTPTDAAAGSMNLTRDLHTATLLTNGRVLVTGGFTTTGSTGTTPTAEIYFPNTQTWFQINSMNQARENHAAVLLGDGRVLVTGGYANGAYMNSCEIYDPIAGTWTTVASMNTARALHQATLLQDGRVLVTGGVNQQGVLGAAANGVEIYNETTNVWAPHAGYTTPALMPQGLYSHRATLLFDGRVLVSGGDNGAPGETTTSIIYDPVGNTWTNTTGALGAARLDHAAALLPDGIVMVSGGAQAASGNAFFGVETFNLSASSWTSNGNMLEPRAGHTMVLSPTSSNTGNVYAIGGAGNVVSNNTTLVNSAIDSILFEGEPDGLSAGFPPSTRLSSITAVDENPFDSVSTITLIGVHFQGGTEANGGGAGSANSEQYMPRVVIQALESSGGSSSQGGGGFGLDLTPQLYTAYSGDPNNDPWTKTDSSLTISMPALRTPLAACGLSAGGNCSPSGALLPYGWYQLRTGSNAQYSDGYIIQHGPALPTGSAAVVNLTAITANTVQFTWSAVAGALGYDIYWSSNGVFISTTAGTTFTIDNLSPGTTVGILVAGFNLSGDGPLAASGTNYTLPTPPTNVQIASVTATSLLVEWGAAGNAPGTIYEVSESTDNPNGPTCPVPGVGYNCQAPFTTSFSTPVPTLLEDTTVYAFIANLLSATTYYFRVQAYNEASQSSGFGTQPPLYVSTETRTPVVGVTFTTETTTSIGWTWNAAVPALNVPGGDHYKIYNATANYVLAISTYPYFLDIVGSTNTPRLIAISAVTSGAEGPLTDGTTVYTLSAVPSFINPPITFVSTGSFNAVWGAGGNPLGTIYDFVFTPLLAPGIGFGPGSTGSTVAVNGFNILTIVSPAPPGTLYFTEVYSMNGNGIASNPLILGTTATLASPPTGLTIAGVGTTSVTVNWNTNGNSLLDTYEVSYSTNAFGYVDIAEPFLAQSDVSTFTITGLQTGTTYSFRVRAENYSGITTTYSNSVTTAPLNGGGQPSGLLEGIIVGGQNNDIQGYIGVGPSRYIDLSIPIGALPPGTQVTISTFLAAAPPCGNPATAIGFQVVTNPLVEPTAPLFLTLGYTAADIPVGTSLSTLQLERFDLTGVCVPIPTTFNTGASELTAEINHLSLFQVGGVPGSTDIGETVIFPNPFYPSRGQGYVTFENMPSFSHIRIYTTRGELVNDSYANGSGLLLWGGTNSAGRSVASGVYLAVVESGGSKRIFKVVVVR